mmetsp:Transcript_42659/g.99434  ORF Transcript_42659/g.99434 Transcript_42659/m.99434 type:complete len:288 (+) Transcript_42659:752-1615(+)
MVEVLHDDTEALVLLSDQIGHGNFDLIELYISRAAGPDALAVHPLGHDPWHRIPLEQQHRHPSHPLSTRPHSASEVVREDPIGDPLLVAVHDVEIPLSDGGGLDGCHVAASGWLCDVQRDDLPPHEAVRRHALLHLLRAEVQHGRQANLEPLDEAPQDASAAAPGKLVHEDELMEVVQVLWSLLGHKIEGTRMGPHHHWQQTSLCTLHVRLPGHCLVHLPLAHEGHDVLFHEAPTPGAPRLVRLLVVGAVVGSVVPVRVPIRIPSTEAGHRTVGHCHGAGTERNGHA